MRNKIGIYVLTSVLCIGLLYTCQYQAVKKSSEDEYVSSFKYPEGKTWAHGVNDTLTAQQKSARFDGIEVDLNFSSYQNQLFVGHELSDTVNLLSFDMWVKAIPYPQEHWYWIDMKNLNERNADSIADIILQVSEKYGIKHRLMVENKNEKALKILKDRGLYVILWVDNIYYSQRSSKAWLKLTRAQVKYLHPDALSCEYTMFPLLPQSFPKLNIHFWHTPNPYNAENVAATKNICSDTSVKVVLVDYDFPVENYK